jgi:hypothetical protein
MNASAGGSDNLEKAAERLRDAAKWLIGAFGAVAAVIFAGLTASNLGKLTTETPGHRLTLALVGAVVAIVGIAYALAVAIRLASASTITVRDLTRELKSWELSLEAARKDLKADPALAPWGAVEHLIGEYEKAYKEYDRWAKAYAESTSTRPNPAQFNKAKFHLETLSEIVGGVLRTMSFLRLQHAFGRARIAIVVAMALAAAGALSFAWATTSVPPAGPQLGRQAVTGVLRPDDTVLKALNRQLPAACQFKSGDSPMVIVISGDHDKVGVIAQPRAVGGITCPPAGAEKVPQTYVTSN